MAEHKKEAQPKEEEKKTPPRAREALTKMNLRPGAIVRVSLKIIEGEKERIQVFEGMVIAIRGNSREHRTITVRKTSFGFGVERILPLAMPSIVSIEVVRQAKVRRAKLNYLRASSARKPKEVVLKK